MPSSPPTVGRIVHYRSFGTPGGEYGSHCRAALVTEGVASLDDEEQRLSLAVLNPTGLFFDTAIPYADPSTPRGGTWHWPCVITEENPHG